MQYEYEIFAIYIANFLVYNKMQNLEGNQYAGKS